MKKTSAKNVDVSLENKTCSRTKQSCKAATALLACAALCTTIQAAYADGTVTVGSATVTDFKGFGVMAAPYDRQTPTYANGDIAWGDGTWLGSSGAVSSGNLFNGFKDLSMDILRTYISPTIGKSDNSLDTARIQDLKDHLQSFKNMGVTKYILTVWSPPAYMKTPDQVRYGKYQGRVQSLNSTYADGSGYDYADYLVAVLSDLKAAGHAAPLAISIQNEPSVDSIYDGCVWTENETQKNNYRTVIKQLRAKLNAKNDSWFGNVQIHAADDGAYVGVTDILGAASASGFANLNSDTTLRDALGGFAWHTYATAGNIKDIRSAMLAYPAKDRWMTEYSTSSGVRNENYGAPSMSLRPYAAGTGGSGSAELNWTFDFVRRMGGDLVDLRANYWFFWRGWHPSSAADDQDLLYGDGGKSKAYYVFQKLWQNVDAGWKVKQAIDTDSDLRTDNEGLITGGSGDQWSAPVDIVAFESGDATKSCVLLTNWTSSSKNITGLSGLKGANAAIFRTSSTENMAAQTARTVSSGTLQGGNLTLPAYSITIVVTSGSTQGSNQLSNSSFDAEAYDTQTPSGWSTYQWDANWNTVTANADYTEAYGGSKSGARHGTHYFGTTFHRIYTYQTRSGLNNGLYTLRAWVKSSGGQTYCQMEAKDHGDNNSKQVQTTTTTGKSLTTAIGTYELIEIKNINVTNGNCTIGFYTQSNGNHNWLYFDDVEFFKQ